MPAIRLLARLLVVFILFPLQWLFAQTPTATTSLQAIDNVRVVDVENGVVTSPQRVVVDGTKILSIGPSSDIPLPKNGTVVDGRGLFLIPGLFDAHVHLTADPATFPPLLVAHGVTSVRDLGGPTFLILRMKRTAATSELPCPDITATGAIVDGDPPIWPFSEPCKTADDAVSAVRKLAAAGVDQIKVYSMLPAEAYRGAVDEATKRGLKVTGHVPFSVPLPEAVEQGQDCIEHLEGFAPFYQTLAAEAKNTGEQNTPGQIANAYRGWTHWEKVDRQALREHLASHVTAKVTHCPTLVVMHAIGRMTDPDNDPRVDPRMKRAGLSSRMFWDTPRYNQFSPVAQASFPAMQETVGELYKAGVTLVVGTDLANPYVFAGSAVHDEMQFFADAGIPPAEILKMATLYPAQLCDVADQRGTIAVGKTASFVLLRENPLDDIAAVREIEAVWLRGRHFDREALAKLIETVESQINGSDPGPDDPNSPDLRAK